MAQDTQHIITIFGSDEGLVSQHASERFARLSEGTNTFSHEIIDGNAPDADSAASICYQIRDAIQTVPFFPGLKIVWLKGANFLGDSVTGRAEATEKGLQTLSDLISGGLPDDVCLLVSAFEFDKRRAFNKLLLKSGSSEEFSKPDITQSGWEEQVAVIAGNAAQKRGLVFDRDALDIFVHRVSESSRQIISEIEKIDIYLGQERRTVTEQDIRNMVSQTRTGIVFEISRAIESGKVSEAIQLIDFQLEKGDQAVGIIRAAFIPALRSMIAARIICDTYSLNPSFKTEFYRKMESIPPYAQKLIPLKKDGTPNYYSVFLAAQKLGKKTLSKLKKNLYECLQADKSLVSSSLDAQLVLHRLAISLAS